MSEITILSNPSSAIRKSPIVSWRLAFLISTLAVYGPFVVEALYAAFDDYRNYIKPKDWMFLPAAPCFVPSLVIPRLFATSIFFSVAAVVALSFLVSHLNRLQFQWKLLFSALPLFLIAAVLRWPAFVAWNSLGGDTSVNSPFDLLFVSTILSIFSVVAVTFLVRRLNWLRSLYLVMVIVGSSALAVFYYHLIRA